MKLRIFITGLFCLFITIVVDAQSTKNVHHSFDANEATTLNLSNSFGDVNIEPYAGSKIEIEVTITIEPKNSKNLEEYFERITIEASETGNTVSVRTVNNLNGGWKVKNFDIDYDVKIPEGTNLKVKNSFGDVKIHGTDGTVELYVQHGDCFIAEAGDENNSIRVEFGDLRVKKMGVSEIDVQHGDVTLGKVGPLNLDLQFGDGTIEFLDGDSKIEIAHGDLDIEMISSKLSLLDIEAQFSDVEISGIGAGDFVIELEGSFCDFDFDSSWYKKKQIKDYNTEEYILYTRGETGGSTQKIVIEASHSDVDLE